MIATEPPPADSQLRLLLVDDEESVRFTLAAVLQRDGYAVTAASSLREARRHLATQAFDVVLADMRLEHGESGLDVATAALQRDPDVVTMILTGYVSTEAAVEALRGGVGNFLAKPCNLDELRLAIQRGLQKRQLMADLRAAKRDAEGKAEAERARRAAEQRAARLAAFQAGTAALAAAGSPQEVARTILRTAITALGATGGALALLSQDGQWLDIAETLNLDIPEGWQRLALDTKAPLAEAVRTSKPVLLGSGQERAERYPELSRAVPRKEAAWASMPLLADQRCLGALALVFAQEHHFDDEDRQFIALLSSQGAQALDRARLYEIERQARAEAERARAQAEAAMEAGQVGAWEWDFATGRLEWSDRMCQLFAVDREDFDGRAETFLGRIHEEDRAAVQQAMRRGLEGQPYQGDYRVVWPDGSLHWLSGAGRVLSRDGRPLRMVGVVTDVTAAKNSQAWDRFLAAASAELGSSLDPERVLERVAELAVPVLADWCAVDLVEGSGYRTVTLAHVDPAKVEWAWQLQRRYPTDPAAPTGVPQVLRSGQPELYSEIPEELLEQGAQDEEHLRIIRELRMGSAMIVPLIASGRVLGALSFIGAESGRRYQPEDLARAEALASRAALAIENAGLYAAVGSERSRLQQIVDTLPHGVSVVDAQGRVVLSNAASLALAGSPLNRGIEAYADHGIWHIDGSPMASADSPLAVALRERRVVSAQQMLVRHSQSGARVPILVSAAPLLDGRGELMGAVSVFEDISDIKSLERQKDDFLGAAAHDLRTPITAIRGVLQVLERRARRADSMPSEQVVGSLHEIERGTKRMSALINQLLDLARLDSRRPLELQRGAVDLVELARQTVDDCQRISEEHHIRLDTSEAELIGQWDAPRLERVLANLLSNAIKYSPAGGEVLVRVERAADSGCAVLTVHDSGIGIPPSDLERVFERFQRASNAPPQVGGTGIGLSYVRQVVEEHGGSVAVDSAVGQGSSFIIRLPVNG